MRYDGTGRAASGIGALRTIVSADEIVRLSGIMLSGEGRRSAGRSVSRSADDPRVPLPAALDTVLLRPECQLTLGSTETPEDDPLDGDDAGVCAEAGARDCEADGERTCDCEGERTCEVDAERDCDVDGERTCDADGERMGATVASFATESPDGMRPGSVKGRGWPSAVTRPDAEVCESGENVSRSGGSSRWAHFRPCAVRRRKAPGTARSSPRRSGARVERCSRRQACRGSDAGSAESDARRAPRFGAG